MWCCHVLETRSDMDGIQGIIGRRGSEVRRAAATGECSTGGGGGRGGELPRWLLLEAQNRAAGCSGQRL